MSNLEKLDDSNLDNIAGGNTILKDVMGIQGLDFSDGSYTLSFNHNARTGWYYNGIRISEKKAFDKIFEHGTQDVQKWIKKSRKMGLAAVDQGSLDLFEDYIRNYNDNME